MITKILKISAMLYIFMIALHYGLFSIQDIDSWKDFWIWLFTGGLWQFLKALIWPWHYITWLF